MRLHSTPSVCLGCHNNLNDPTGTTRARADGSSRPVTLGEKWITQDLVKNGKLAKQMKDKLGKDRDGGSDWHREAVNLYDGMSYN